MKYRMRWSWSLGRWQIVQKRQRLAYDFIGFDWESGVITVKA